MGDDLKAWHILKWKLRPEFEAQDPDIERDDLCAQKDEKSINLFIFIFSNYEVS